MNRPLKWLLISLTTIAMLVGGFVVYNLVFVNANVTEELRNNPLGERAGIVMLLTFADGRKIPVNYLREGDQVFVGADGPWWREFQDGGAPVMLEIRGQTLTGHALAVLGNPSYVKEIFARLRPTVPSWLPDWLNAKLVTIKLYSAPTDRLHR